MAVGIKALLEKVNSILTTDYQQTKKSYTKFKWLVLHWKQWAAALTELGAQ